MASYKIISQKFPYLPIVITVRHRTEKADALVDTGFEGDIVVPKGLLTNGDPPDTIFPWQLADGTVVLAPVYTGKVKIGKMPSFAVMITTLGDEVIVGRRLTNRFTLILDHGKKLILEP